MSTAATADTTAPAARGWRRLTETARLIRIEHTLFALPFAIVGAFEAAGGLPPAQKIAWILVAMVSARSAAMAFNRLADARWDAANPRTAMRHLPRGIFSRRYVALFTLVSAAVFVLAAAMLNRLALALAPVALAIVFIYSYTKRFTAASHFVLGLGLAIAPAGAWVAVRGDLGTPAYLLAAAVLTWTAGFDILYALQDVEFDRSHGLHSVPARLGPAGALWVARAAHAAMLAALVAYVVVVRGGGIAWLAPAVALAVLAWEHVTVAPLAKPGALAAPGAAGRIERAFFAANALLAPAIAAILVFDILMAR